MKNPLLYRSAWPESSREASEGFVMETLARTQSERRRRLGLAGGFRLLRSFGIDRLDAPAHAAGARVGRPRWVRILRISAEFSPKIARFTGAIGGPERGVAVVLLHLLGDLEPPQRLDLPLRRARPDRVGAHTTWSAPSPFTSVPIIAAQRRGSATVLCAKIWPRSP